MNPETVNLTWLPSIDTWIHGALAVAVVWLLIEAFIWWRRKAVNLTVTETAARRAGNDPDFLTIDHKKRTEALRRGDEYDQERKRRDAAANQAVTEPVELSIFSTIGKLVGIAAVAIATITVVLAITGCLWPESFAGQMMQQYDTQGRLSELIQKNILTIGATIALNVVFLVRMLYSIRSNTAAA